MFSCLSAYYLWFKSFHIFFLIAWMAGIFYLPRLFYYHALNLSDSKISSLFSLMESRLLKIIMNPAQILTYIFGILLILTPGILSSPNGWFHLKILLVLSLSAFHGFCVHIKRQLSKNYSPLSPNTYRMINEIPTFLLIAIILLVVFKPF